MRVVSWNIHWGCGKDGRIRIHAIIDVLRKLNPDVICLQEVAANHPELEGNASANQFRQLAGAFGGYQPVHRAHQRNLPEQHAAPVRQPAAVEVPHHPGAPPLAALAARPGQPGRHAARPDRSGGRSARRQAARADHPPRILFASPAHGAGQAHQVPALGSVRARAPVPARLRPRCAVPAWLPARLGDLLRRLQLHARVARTTPRCWRPTTASRCRWSMPGALTHPDSARAPTAGLHGFKWPDRPDMLRLFLRDRRPGRRA